jgi:hypothetical protein
MVQFTQADGPEVAPDSGAAPQESAAARRKARPKRILPTDRIAFPKQLDILRAHAVLSNEGEKAATNTAVGDFVGMKHTTVTLANAFFVDSGLLIKSNGSHVPAREVIEFARATEWGDENAGNKFAPRLRESWFGQSILRRLSFRPTMDEAEAVRQLAQEASAPPDYKGQVVLLLAFLEVAGLIERDGSQVRKADPSSPSAPPPQPTPTPAPTEDRPNPPNLLVRPEPTKGGVNFQISLQVDMDELAGWDPQRITAFFSGIAAVLAAKGELEGGDSQE